MTDPQTEHTILEIPKEKRPAAVALDTLSPEAEIDRITGEITVPRAALPDRIKIVLYSEKGETIHLNIRLTRRVRSK